MAAPADQQKFSNIPVWEKSNIKVVLKADRFLPSYSLCMSAAKQVSAELTVSVWRGRMRPDRIEPKKEDVQEIAHPKLYLLIWNLSLSLMLSLTDR